MTGAKATVLAIMPSLGPCRVSRRWNHARAGVGPASGPGGHREGRRAVTVLLVVTGREFEEKMDTLIGAGILRSARGTWCIRLRVLTGLREALHARA
jgi:hypothetical protein